MKSEIINEQLHVEGLKEPLIRLNRQMWLTVDAVTLNEGYSRYEDDEPPARTASILGRGRLAGSGFRLRIAGTDISSDVFAFTMTALEETVETQKHMWAGVVSYLKASDEFGFGNQFFINLHVPMSVIDEMRDAIVNKSLHNIRLGLAAPGLWAERIAFYIPHDSGFDWMLQPSSDGDDCSGYHNVSMRSINWRVADAAAYDINEAMAKSLDPEDDGSPQEDRDDRPRRPAPAARSAKKGWFG